MQYTLFVVNVEGAHSFQMIDSWFPSREDRHGHEKPTNGRETGELNPFFGTETSA